jgi:signal transduction histidine kinase
MKLSDFIRSRTSEIVRQWENFARTCLPAASTMDDAALRDHVVELLRFIADDMDSPQSNFEQAEKGQGRGPKLAADTEAEKHAIMRVADGFTIDQVMGEFRALRASVLHLCTKESVEQFEITEITRFNECIDQVLCESLARHTTLVADVLRDSNRQKDEFISTLSHELRNPVGAISSCAEILNDSATKDPAVARVVDILARQTGHLTRLLEDLLDVARISRKRIIFKIEATDIRTCVQDAVDANSQLITRKGQTIKVDMPSSPLTMHVDCTRVAQVVSNLVNNAVKYSPTSSTIKVSLTIDTDHAAICVTDNGVGIEARLLPHVFEAFYLNRAGDLAKQGLGIGLWLSRQLIEMQGGTITVESAGRGTGAEFCVRLPLYVSRSLVTA